MVTTRDWWSHTIQIPNQIHAMQHSGNYQNKMIKKNQKPHSRNIAAELGRRGGLAIAKKRGKNYMQSIGKRGAEARWKIKT